MTIFVEAFHKDDKGRVTVQRRIDVTKLAKKDRAAVVAAYERDLDEYDRQHRGVRIVEVNR